MSDLIRGFDWASTPLGPMEDWPASLRFALSLCERTPYPTAIYWGPDFHLIYNDAWSPVPGLRHPEALGKPAREVWPDIWDIVEPQFQQVVDSGQGMSFYDQMLPMTRNGILEETYWNYSFTPVMGEDGAVAGILNHGHEITRTVFAERRLSFQMKLADRLRHLREPAEIKAAAIELLGEYLGAARVGYAEVDPSETTVAARREWTRDPETESLTGQSAPLAAFGAGAADFLRAGEPIAIGEVQSFAPFSGRHVDGWTAVGGRAMIVVPLVRGGGIKALLYVLDGKPRAWMKSEIAMARDVAERTWDALERAQAEQWLRESEDHYRHAVELNPQVSWTSLPSGNVNRIARRWYEWTGMEGDGDAWANGIHPDDRAQTLQAWGLSLETGDPFDIEHRILRREGGYRWARSRAFPRFDAAGEVVLWYGATEDIHERKLGEERQRLLINELNHRVKNTLATVQAIAFQTLKPGIPLDEARARFEARLMALSRAHNLLTDQNWEGASLERVVRDSTEHFAPDRFAVDGEEVWLGPRAALALALALHELSTNAAKYGALSIDGGRVAIRWFLDETGLRLEWKENGGPEVVAPAARGFGSRLIERGLSADLGGRATIHFEPDGLRCTIDAGFEAMRSRDERG